MADVRKASAYMSPIQLNQPRKVILSLLVLLLLAAVALTIWQWQPVATKNRLPEIRLNLIPEYEVVTTQAASIWPADTVLDPASAAYSYTVRPQIRLAPVVMAEPFPQGQLAGTLLTTLTLQAINDTGKTYWSIPLPKTAEQPFILQAETENAQAYQTVSFSAQPVLIDPALNYTRAERISEELGFENARIQLVAQIETTVSGQLDSLPVEKSLSTSWAIPLNQTSFSTPSTTETAASLTIYSESGAPSGALVMFRDQVQGAIQNNPATLAIDALLLIALVALGLSRKPLRQRRAASMIDHRRFREWITEGTVQMQDKTPIQVNGLEGLVDLAIDIDKRVIFDSVQKKYFVLDDQIIYSYDPQRSPSMNKGRLQLGKILIQNGSISREQLETALYYHQRTGLHLGESLMALGFITEKALYKTLAEQEGSNFFEEPPEKIRVNQEALAQMTLSQAYALMAVPIGRNPEGNPILICSKSGRERDSVQKVLEDAFPGGLELQVAQPSVVQRILDTLLDQAGTPS